MATLLTLLFQCFSLLSLISSTIVSANLYRTPRLGISRAKELRELYENAAQTQPNSEEEYSPNDFKTFFYPQTLDHFNYGPESYTRFKQRYIMYSKYWGGAKKQAPIFVKLGDESPLEDEHGDFLSDIAPRFQALVLHIEHRFYGKSIPFFSFDKAMKNATIRGYFNSVQALADYAEIILYIKEKYKAHHSPVIVFGGSYAGDLATWFRLQYPHIALGALASSAPILYFDNIVPQNSYDVVVTKEFRKTSESCYQTIKSSWSEIDRVGSQPKGLSILSKKFKTCKPINGTDTIKGFLEYAYSDAAQYSHQNVVKICGAIDGAPKGTDILSQIVAALDAINEKKEKCYRMADELDQPDCWRDKLDQPKCGWRWQKCSDLVMPIGRDKDDTLFPVAPFSYDNYTKDCISEFGVPPRPHWITTYYGGHDIKLVLQRFGSNIIFSNGLRDPYSSGGVLEDISKTIVAINTAKGTHCLDILEGKPSDPKWLVKQRQREIDVIKEWIAKYYTDLQSMKKNK